MTEEATPISYDSHPIVTLQEVPHQRWSDIKNATRSRNSATVISFSRPDGMSEFGMAR